ncbi:MAG: hypothetical protein CSA38_02690 [Flavobacteriales bacterium]|nr:MAG: hypothetical protein CSA38_02690 [Flavobacteriales bacterium]
MGIDIGKNNKMKISVYKSKSSISIKLGNDYLELNISELKFEDIEKFKNIEEYKWENRNSIKAGKTLDSDVFWSFQEGRVTILIGQDDECWEVGINISLELLSNIIKQCEN